MSSHAVHRASVSYRGHVQFPVGQTGVGTAPDAPPNAPMRAFKDRLEPPRFPDTGSSYEVGVRIVAGSEFVGTFTTLIWTSCWMNGSNPRARMVTRAASKARKLIIQKK